MTKTNKTRNLGPNERRVRGLNLGRWGGMFIASATMGACAAGWLTSADYSEYEHEPKLTARTDLGLTVLINFPAGTCSEDVAGKPVTINSPAATVSDAQAQEIYRSLNELGYSGTSGSSSDPIQGSVDDYFRDMSGGKQSVKSRVVRVTAPEAQCFYDTRKGDEFGSQDDTLAGITSEGPAMDLLMAVADLLKNPAGQVELITTSAPVAVGSSYDVYENLSRRTLSYWPDDYLRQYMTAVGSNPALTKGGSARNIDIAEVEVLSLVSLMYAGASRFAGNRDMKGNGLWPRSIPSPGTKLEDIHGNDVPAGRFQLLGTGNSGAPAIGTLIHETAHTLFDLPDLYDSGKELGVEGTPSLVSSHGVGIHSLMGSTPNQHTPPTMSAPLRDRLGWIDEEDIYDLNDLEEGTLVELDTNGQQIARYCREESAADECFYFEGRSASAPRGASGKKVYAPDEGLVIWHAERRHDVLDFIVNNHEEEGDRNLHYEISLMQADGLRELEQNTKATWSSDNDYFSGSKDRFDDFSAPNSRWWDHTASGIAIRDIKNNGSTVSFRLGARPISHLEHSLDSQVSITGDLSPMPTGELRSVTMTPKSGYQFDVYLEGKLDGDSERGVFERRGVTSNLVLPVLATAKDTFLRVVSYPLGQSAPADPSITMHFQLSEGVKATTYVEKALTYEGESRLYRAANRWTSLRSLGNTERASNYAARIPVSADRRDIAILMEADRGYLIDSYAFYGLSNDYSSGIHKGPFKRLREDFEIPPDAISPDEEYLTVVTARPDPSYFCRREIVTDWIPDTVYSDIGDFVRYSSPAGDFVYRSTVPRAYLRGTSLTNPEDSPQYWTRYLSCSAASESCASKSEFSLGGDPVAENPATAAWLERSNVSRGDEVVQNGFYYRGESSSTSDIPGAHVSLQTRAAAQKFSFVEKTVALYHNRNFSYPSPSSWTLLGTCADSANTDRFTIQPNEGATVSRVNGAKVQHSVGDVSLVYDFQSDVELGFDIEAGYELSDVYIDGIAQGLSSSDRSLTVAYTGGLPPYVEIRTCLDGACR